MIQSVESLLRERGWIRPGSLILAAVSGGSDSMALLYLLWSFSRKRPFRLAVLHIHHGLRGKESDLDADFVRLHAWKLGIPCYLEYADVRGVMRKEGFSMEMAARKERHRIYRDVSCRLGAAAVAVGHTRDDQAETLLMRLIRGCGIDGLGGMDEAKSMPDFTLIRPLIEQDRARLQEFLRRNGLPWREDVSNQCLDMERNRVRQELIPFIQQTLNASVVDALSRTADIHRAERSFLQQRTEMLLKEAGVTGRGASIKKGWLRALHLADQRRVLVAWLRGHGVVASAVDYDLVERIRGLAGKGREATTPVDARHVVICSGNVLTVEPQKPGRTAFSYRFPFPGSFSIPECGLTFSSCWTKGYRREPGRPAHYPVQVQVSARMLSRVEALTVRSWKAGDRYHPVGLKGCVKLQDLFTNAKVPRRNRLQVPVVAVGEEIIWVAGFRLAEGFRVRSGGEPSLQIRVEQLGGVSVGT